MFGVSPATMDCCAALGPPQLWRKKPDLLANRTLVALSAIRHQKAAEAAAPYDDWTTDWSKASEPAKAVYVAAMRMAGRTAEAHKVLAFVKMEVLRPEERQLAGLL